MWRRSEKLLPRDLARKGGAFFVFSERWGGALFRKSHWMLLSGIACAILGFVTVDSRRSYTAAATLIRNENRAETVFSPAGEAFKTSGYTAETLMEVMRSTEIIRRVVSASGLPVMTEQVTAQFEVSSVPGTELLRLSVRDRRPDQAALLIDRYAKEAVRFTQELQSNEVRQVKCLLNEKLAAMNEALDSASAELINFQRSLGLIDFDRETSSYVQQGIDLDQKSENLRVQIETLNLEVSGLLKEISKHHPALLGAQRELSQALLRYTEEHPKVKKLRATLASLEAQIAERGAQIDPDVALNGSSLAQSLYTKLIELRTGKVTLSKQLEEINHSKNQLQARLKGLPESRSVHAKLLAQLESLKSTRDLLAQRQREAQLLEDHASGYYRILEPAQAGDLRRTPQWPAEILGGLGGGFFGICLAAVSILLLELANKRIRSEADLRRATALPVLATLGDLRDMSAEERQQWAFRTLMTLKGKFSHSGSQALICGFISARHGEGRSTWVELLANAAKRCGYRVLTISTNSSGQNPLISPSPNQAAEHLPDAELLPARLEIPFALMSAHSDPKLELPLSNWVWALENRQQWKEAVRKWKGMDNSAVFLDLPPASAPEAVLLAEDFSALIWLCGKDMADIAETRTHLETLRHARSGLAGVVFNRASTRPWKKRLGHLVSIGVALMPAFVSSGLSAQETTPPAAGLAGPKINANANFSVSSPAQLADWQKHFTLGAGDVLNISLYEQPDSERKNLIIGPDGRLNYLQARDVVASGLTVDELRGQLEQVLAKFYRPPLRIILLPQAYNSKKYYLLGNVVQKGVFPLDRPVTILEAIAQAQGFVTTVERKNTLMLADLPRAFLVRKEEGEEPKRVKVDFEGLFLRGDLTHNITLAPGDYLYFPPLDLQEIYVLGEVLRPGVSSYTPEMTGLRAIASRGGFTEKAYRQKVLIVRGSLNHPQTFILSVSDILNAQGSDRKLEARDIVYVSRKPWYKAEQLLETAVSDFMRAAVIAWTGKNVGPFIKEPLF